MEVSCRDSAEPWMNACEVPPGGPVHRPAGNVSACARPGTEPLSAEKYTVLSIGGSVPVVGLSVPRLLLLQ